jgi:hypothetical protein
LGARRLVCFYCPEPVNATLCGLFVALSVNLKVADCVPVDAGLNVTLMTQLAPTFSFAGAVPQVVLETLYLFALVPVMLQERLRSAPVPVFEMVSASVAVLPRFTPPKLRLLGLSVTVGEFTVCETPADVLLLKLLSPP